MKIILPSGHECLFDDEDAPALMKHKWHIDSKGYAKTYSRDKKAVYMHYIVLDCPPGFYRDHINQNKLDNRRCNLRVVTPKQNTWNTPKRKNGSSQYKGVSRFKKTYWRARICGKDVGYFKTEEEAARAYDKAAQKLFGEYAKLNFCD